MIIGINMETNDNFGWYTDFCACDVSWISNYSFEKEILIKRGCMVSIIPHMIQYDERTKIQWVVCGSGAYWDDESSLQSLFCL